MNKLKERISAVYKDRPDYADFDAPAKFEAIKSIIAKRLVEHPRAVCAYSGGSDSDIMVDLIERTRNLFGLPTVKYVFYNTGLEMKAIKDHVKSTAEKYGIEIETVRPKINVVQATKKFGVPFLSKISSIYIGRWQKHPFPLSVVDQYNEAPNKPEMIQNALQTYGCNKTALIYFCSCDPKGNPIVSNQFAINNTPYLKDFLRCSPPNFKISEKCCDYCKKALAHSIENQYDMIITGEREAEGGARKAFNDKKGCFVTEASGRVRLKPLYYVSNNDKAWYKEYYGIKYSDAYEVYGLTRTGCCGCPIPSSAVDDLELIKPYEPQLVKAAWNVFGESYRYRQKYVAYKEERMKQEKEQKKTAKLLDDDQLSLF